MSFPLVYIRHPVVISSRKSQLKACVFEFQHLPGWFLAAGPRNILFQTFSLNLQQPFLRFLYLCVISVVTLCVLASQFSWGSSSLKTLLSCFGDQGYWSCFGQLSGAEELLLTIFFLSVQEDKVFCKYRIAPKVAHKSQHSFAECWLAT